MRLRVFPPKENVLGLLFRVSKPILGTLHVQPLPGSPQFRGGAVADVITHTLGEAKAMLRHGVDGLIVENGWDLPFVKPEDVGFETVASLAAVASFIVREIRLPVGINCLANAVIQSLAIAKASGAHFIRSNQWVNAYVANEGVVEGPAGRALRYRSSIRGEAIRVFADVHVKHGSHAIVADRGLAEQVKDAEFFDSDVLIVTGTRTGDPPNLEELRTIRDASYLPVIIGSGLTADNAPELLRYADGAIVGSYFKQDGYWWNAVEESRVETLMSAVRKIREAPN